LITDNWGWPWVFWINIPIGIVAFALAAIAIPRGHKTEATGFDFGGTWSLTTALVALVLGVSWVGDEATTIAAVVAFGITAIACAAFFWIELRVDEPLVPLHQFRDRTFAAGVALSAIIGIAIFSVTAYLPTYIQMAYQTSATVSGLIPIATVMGMLASNLTTGFLASRTGRYRRYHIAGTVLGTAGMTVMALLPSGGPLWVPMVVMFVVGLGAGSFMSLVVAVVQSAVPHGEIGSATATVNLVRQISSTVATAAIGVVIAVGVTDGLPSGLNSSTLTPQVVHELSPKIQAEIAALYGSVFVPVFAALAITFAIGIVTALLLPAGRLSDEPVTVPNSSPTAANSR
jgi:MFS family permease